MRPTLLRLLQFSLLLLLTLGLSLNASAQDGEEATSEEGADGGGEPTEEGGQVEEGGEDLSLQRGGRMEFDGRLVRGETAGAGAVFLFERTPRRLPSMVNKRESFLDDTVYSVLGPQIEDRGEAAASEEGEDDGSAKEEKSKKTKKSAKKKKKRKKRKKRRKKRKKK